MELKTITLIILTISTIILFLLYKNQKKQLKKLFDKYQELDGKKRSGEVKHGQNWEQFVPFAKDFPFTKEKFKFLGQPIDGLSFEEDKIIFCEIKTGKSKLNNAQKHVKQLVQDKKVEWKEFRY